jgi:hypothetical protein
MMARYLIRLAAVGALSVTALATPLFASASTPGRGTFTQVTSPAKTLTYRFTVGQLNQIHVAGRTSLDVTQVDVVCVTYVFDQEPDVETVASAVPVSSGSFVATATLPSSAGQQCRLIAVPDGVDAHHDYLGSFTGPILYIDAFGLTRDGAHVTYSYSATAEEGDGTALLTDVGSCGAEALVTVQAPQMQAGGFVLSCLFALPSTNFGPSGPATGSTIQIDGHNAYLPSGVHSLIENHSLTVTQSALTATHTIAHNGDVTFTESALLMRCSASNAYPPTTVSCPHLVSTGVRYERVSTLERDGHQVKVRDAFTSTDHHAHSASLQYQANFTNESGGGSATGDIGYAFPGHGSSFHPSGLGQTINGFGSKAGTVLIRSDVDALPSEGAADTTAGTWSRPPSKVFFGESLPNQLQMQYALKVPAGRSAFIGFAISERWTTAEVKPLAAAGAADFVVKPTISSPHRGAKLHGRFTTVKGSLTAGANGLPTKVTVNGHAAKITARNTTHATYQVRFHESAGRHAIKVVATDAVGNSASAATLVKNV